ncbi:DNA-3-methyladenine glycosylase II [Paenibacillus sp. UNC496MF]|uniref:DNA-3-methyladenine glycosylase family protein n=1 Tax=Paenibacillus sp. UNC496MF TaxID=1502753 RepID=UPI0008ED9A37|nr:DNA-3-methyladenine glycosylase [Paenibacillus sp. UNC496MF]SFI33557.1 DNA-3-methyladenine glycosylase II [Paenibacillus sp. UNC496MF]
MAASITIETPDVFDFAPIIDYLNRSANECLYEADAASVTRLVPAGGSPALVRLSARADGALAAEFLALTGPPDDATARAVTAYVRDWFDMDRDLSGFLALASGDEVLAPAVRRFRGLRIVGIADLFEALCWGIMGQQINLTFAYTLKRRFVERYGAAFRWDGRAYWTFPAPERIAAIDPAELRDLQFTGRKAEYVVGVARLMADGALSKAGLLALPDWTAREKALTAIRGIGPWTAHYVLMRCLRNPGAFPLEDVGLHNALKAALGREEKPSLAEIKALAAPWGEWKAYATFYLWRLLY